MRFQFRLSTVLWFVTLLSMSLALGLDSFILGFVFVLGSAVFLRTRAAIQIRAQNEPDAWLENDAKAIAREVLLSLRKVIASAFLAMVAGWNLAFIFGEIVEAIYLKINGRSPRSVRLARELGFHVGLWIGIGGFAVVFFLSVLWSLKIDPISSPDRKTSKDGSPP